MKYEALGNSFFSWNRSRFVKEMKANSVAIFNSNDLMPTNADATFPFKQNNDLFYLSGVDQEETSLILFPDHDEEKFREILFIKSVDENTVTWEGNKLSKIQATELSGIKSVYWHDEFEKTLGNLLKQAEIIYLNSNEHQKAENSVVRRDQRFIKWCKDHFPLHKFERSTAILHQLRSVKSQVEINTIRKACDITKKGFIRALKAIKPGMMEYEIEAEFIYEFIRNGSRGFAYEPIVASGKNSCILHYTLNDKPCYNGDLILLDIGAEYGNYNADMTRCIPVNGKFTERQKSVYEAVLGVMKEAKSMLTAGLLLKDYNKEVGKIIESELLGLGLLNKSDIDNQNEEHPAYKKYFMHNISHHLGLDVHDVSPPNQPLEPGMVLTVEPGIYIREENLGIRLENDVLITDNKVEDLMEDIPIEIEEIETIMNEQHV